MKWLTKVHKWADGRIANGDLDFDDVVYPTRDAAKTLLGIWFPRTQTSEYRHDTPRTTRL